MRLKEGALAFGMLAPIPSGAPTRNAGVVGSDSSNAPNAPNVSTDGIEMEEWEPEDDGGSHHISFTIWDFAGQEVLPFLSFSFFLLPLPTPSLYSSLSSLSLHRLSYLTQVCE